MRYAAEIEMGSCAHRRLVRVFLSVVDGFRPALLDASAE